MRRCVINFCLSYLVSCEIPPGENESEKLSREILRKTGEEKVKWENKIRKSLMKSAATRATPL